LARIKDVAKLAGVSIASVSRYLNSPELLKKETAEAIRKAIETLDYRPSPLAASMRTRKTNTIAFVIPSLTNLYYVDMHTYMHKECKERGYILNLYTTEYDDKALVQYLNDIPTRQYDGVIISHLDEEHVTGVLNEVQEKIPLVLITADPNKTQFTHVFIDAMDGIFKATNHLIELGKKRIAFAGGGESSHISSKEKYKGFKLAMERANLAIEPGYVFTGMKNHFHTGFMAARQFITQPVVPDAIVCSTDDVAMGCIKYLLMNGYRVPDDVAVIGFNGISIVDSFEPAISTVVQPMEMMVKSAIELLLETIKNKNRKRKKKAAFTSTLKIGTSTVKDAQVGFQFEI